MLFYKNGDVSNIHNLKSLFEQCSQTYGKLPIENPFGAEINYEGFDEKTIEQLKTEYNMSEQLQLRYPIDDSNTIYSGVRFYDSGLLQKYRDDMIEARFETFES